MNGCVVTNDAKASLPLHRHDNARIIVVIDGEVRENDLSGQRFYKKGDILFRPPFCAHANDPSGAESSFLRLFVSNDAWRAFVRLNGWRAARGSIYFEDRDQLALLRSKNGDDFLAFLQAAQTDQDNDRNETGLQFLSNVGDLKPYEVTRRFRRRFGLTPSAYRREWRLRRALSLLAYGRDAIADVAAETGFADQSHLSREIKDTTGLTPAGFRAFVRA